jgi:hypothetical protein
MYALNYALLHFQILWLYDLPTSLSSFISLLSQWYIKVHRVLHILLKV